MLTSNPQFPAGPTPDPACHTWQTIAEQRGPGGGLPSQRTLNSATGQLQWPWANIAIERLLAHLGYCYPHHIAFATVGTGSSSNSLHSSKAPARQCQRPAEVSDFVARFRTLREKNTRTCENRTRNACESRMSECF